MSSCSFQNPLSSDKLSSLTYLLEIFSEANRLRALHLLLQRDICVCELAKNMNISHNLLSFHLKKLFEAGILDKRREKNQIFYFIKSEWKDKLENLFNII